MVLNVCEVMVCFVEYNPLPMSWHVLVCYLNKIQLESVNVVSIVISRNTYLSEPHGLGEKRRVYCRHFVAKLLQL